MNRFITILFLTCLFTNICFAQKQTVTIEYQSYNTDSKDNDTSFTTVVVDGNKTKIYDKSEKIENPIPGLSDIFTYVDYKEKKVFTQLFYSDDEKYFTKSSLNNKHLKFVEKGEELVLGYHCKKFFTSINSNSIEIWTTTETGYNASPMSQLGNIEGTLIKYRCNGNSVTEIKKIEKLKLKETIFPKYFGEEKSISELSNILKNRMIITTNVFDKAQLHFGDSIKFKGKMPYDTVIHFAEGSLVLKRLKLSKLPEHYQVFAELHEQSAGDAYDRTGSIFIIPQDREISFYNALTEGIEAIPSFVANNGRTYQGMQITTEYLPLIELIRFFTPFGVSHFNNRSQIEGLEWADEAYYKQEITEFSSILSGDILIGAFIGNYDSGGHKISLDIKAYPQEYEWKHSNDEEPWILPIFNTCNVMEMAGQNYGSFFNSDSLTVNFDIPKGVSNIKLRYISTGHGGWGNGDEFNPKENIIIIDGKQKFSHTPWRTDCGTYREYSPVSGNFWNGVSSSDYSRSGWCPGTATQAVYFDLSFLSEGNHSITIAIPQGNDEGSSFNAWNVSGVLIGEKTK